MGLKFKSVRDNNILALVMIYPDGYPKIILMAESPMDGDWKADVDFLTKSEVHTKSVFAER